MNPKELADDEMIQLVMTNPITGEVVKGPPIRVGDYRDAFLACFGSSEDQIQNSLLQIALKESPKP